METIVVSLGGSVLAPGEPDAAYVKHLAAELRDVARTHRLFVVTGGGRIARAYIEAGRALGASERFLDRLGIKVTRINARLLIAALGGEDADEMPHTIQEAVVVGKGSSLVVMGGTDPGHTTDTVAAELAEAVAANRLVNATSVDGVYTADPAKDPAAKRVDRATYDELIGLAGESHTKAGPSVVFDPQAARIVARANIPLAVVNGRDFEALRNAILGKPFRGTLVG
ncbi:MAG TPA: UMP kinase [Thermoplasmata archaeon]|jgi:uridylate kinase|nr:UMP kinase [Thermoplasmata archaeon]